MFTADEFEKHKLLAEEFYKNTGEVFCPYFQEKIVFNAKGLEHLKFKTKNHARLRDDQYTRFKILHLAPKIISLSRTIQGISHTKNFESIRSNARTEIILKSVSYYEFVAILEEKRVRVVIKQIENGSKYFWSIIPYWKINKTNFERKMHGGNLENE